MIGKEWKIKISGTREAQAFSGPGGFLFKLEFYNDFRSLKSSHSFKAAIYVIRQF